MLIDMKIILIVLAVYWMWCYIKFKRDYKRDCVLLEMLKMNYEAGPSTKTKCELASGYMLCQKYAMASKLFYELKNEGAKLDYLDENIAFCAKPIPGVANGPKDLQSSYWHNFVLKRLGGRRMVDISSDTYLQANAMLRAMDRKK
jgi:hypothetical protein